MVSLEKHGREEAADLRAVEGRSNVLECWSISGDDDYMLRVVATDLRELSDWMMHDRWPLKMSLKFILLSP